MTQVVPQTLSDIRNKFRKIVGLPSPSQISDFDIDGYINTYYLFDLPSSLKLQSLLTTYTFYTQPNVDTYAFDTNNYYSIEPPAYCGGYIMQYLQDRTVFFRTWPKIAYQQRVGTGDGITSNFFGSLTGVPLLRSVNRTLSPPTAVGQNPGSVVPNGNTPQINSEINPGNLPFGEQFREVVFSAQDGNGNSLVVVDNGVLVPGQGPDVGQLIVFSSATSANIGLVVGQINYATGAFDFTFPAAPAAQYPVFCQTTPYVGSRPQTVLLFDNYFTVRPVPNAVYEIVLNAYVKPTAFLSEASNQSPLIQQWWQLLSYGAAKVFFSERLDLEQYQRLMPFYEEQLNYVERRTMQQLSNQRSVTIFTDQNGANYNLYDPLF